MPGFFTSTTTPDLSHLLGKLPAWFCIRTWSPMWRGGSFLECSAHVSRDLACRCLRAASLCAVTALQVGVGWYFPSRTGSRSLICLPKMIWAGDSLVTGSGVLRNVRTARWTASVSSCPELSTLLVIRRFIDFTAISALQLLWGNATELSRWWIPHSFRNRCVLPDVNSGPPSDASSSGTPNVTNDILS